jgi:hypothetical protein
MHVYDGTCPLDDGYIIKLVEGSFWENLENKLKRRGPQSRS